MACWRFGVSVAQFYDGAVSKIGSDISITGGHIQLLALQQQNPCRMCLWRVHHALGFVLEQIEISFAQDRSNSHIGNESS
mmetsp:Transcript_14705/g.24484  ORF Transcript_14705/g.24484 Transcript_14705/m.24484 type:complete len:80 (-) Transcript_14705:330-569(-)